MDGIQIGRRLRALRHRRGWRQLDVSTGADVSRGVVSLIERGRLELVSIEKIRRVALELDAELVMQLRWRGGDLDRLVDEGHAALVGRAVELLKQNGWIARAEISYSIYGERGSIDLLAWHAATRTILVVEVKTELVSLEGAIRKHGEKTRLARRIGVDEGWTALQVGRLLVLPDLSTPRRRVQRFEAVLADAYPARGGEVRSWLRAPKGPMSGILFIGQRPSASGLGPSASGLGRKRIRCRKVA